MTTEYNDERHEYRIDGIIVPGVTTIIKAAGMYDDRFFTEEARQRGTYVHGAALFLVQNDLHDDSILPAYRGYIDGVRMFLSETDCIPDVELCEKPQFNKIFMYGTKIDLPCLFNGHDSIIDYKSGAETPVTGIQLAGQAQLIGKPVKRYGLHLKADGKYKLVEYKDRNDIKIFNAALSLYHWRQKEGLL